jgi:hypothetical protein
MLGRSRAGLTGFDDGDPLHGRKKVLGSREAQSTIGGAC